MHSSLKRLLLDKNKVYRTIDGRSPKQILRSISFAKINVECRVFPPPQNLAVKQIEFPQS